MTILDNLTRDAASKFYRIKLSDEDAKHALSVSPMFLAYLQNKIEAYASTLVDTPLTYDPDPSKQMIAILAYERIRTFVQAYEELLAELLDAHASDMAQDFER